VRIAVSVGALLAQIGEFSFVLAAVGRSLGLLTEPATQSMVAASIVSITLSPVVFRTIEPVTRTFSRVLERREEPDETPDRSSDPGYRAVVVGYGPVGRSLATLLRENGIEPTVIELNHDTVKRLRDEGLGAVYGDSSAREVLESAGVRHAGSLIYAASGPPEATIRMAMELNPGIRILARASYVSQVEPLRHAGAHFVVSAEGEVALAMTEELVRQLGATADQLDRARDRVRSHLGGTTPAPP
jgi:CPA2 family monovalent cation:H+ antiporter-2